MDNQVEDATVDALVHAVTSRSDVVARYYRLKRRLVGLDELFDYDRYAALPATERRFTWPEARHKVLAAYEGFHPRMAEIAELFFDSGWIDASVHPGKRGGAFSNSAVPSVHPYVLVNFQGTSQDVMTLAHELGHGVHQYLARDRGILQQNTPLTTAETASVFGEMLTFQALLAGEHATEADLAQARALFDAVGKVVVVDEPLLDAVTGLSGSGPAYIFLIIEALSDAGVKMGLARVQSQELAAQTVLGSAKLLIETGEHPGRLKDQVTSPGGTAIAGLHTLEAGGLRTTLMNAVEAATRRSHELGKKFLEEDEEP
jgi:hypothetical protein